MTARSRQRLAALARYAVCAAAVSWLVYHTRWDQIKQVLAEADWTLAMFSVLVYGPAPIMIATRLRWLLAVHDIRLSAWQAIKVTFAGNFIITALPVGTSGGDAVKAYYIARDTPHKHEAVTSVFFDRVIGVISLVLLSGLLVLINWGNPALTRWGPPIGGLFLCLLVGSGIYFSNRMRAIFRLDQIVAMLPLAKHVQRIDRAVFAFRHRGKRMIACLLLTAILQTVAVFSVFIAGWALGMVGEHPWSALPIYLAYTPICFLTGALPLGVMEETFVQLFVNAAHLGTRETAISLSLLNRLVQLIWALPGGILVLQGYHRPKPSEILEELGPELAEPEPTVPSRS